MGAIATGCNMDAIQKVWPNGDMKTLSQRSYVVCMKAMMVDLAHIMEDFFPGDRVHVVHDHGSWDDAALEGYNLMIGDPEWKLGHVFDGIEAKRGKDGSAIGLQAADMIAYEVFKGIKAKTRSEDAEMRAVMKEFIKKEVPMSARWIDLKAAQALYRVMKDSGKYPDLDDRGVA